MAPVAGPAGRGSPSDRLVVDHVLLVGIDVYSGEGHDLTGCVNDIDAIQKVLIERLGVPKSRVDRVVSSDDPRQLATILQELLAKD